MFLFTIENISILHMFMYMLIYILATLTSTDTTAIFKQMHVALSKQVCDITT